MQSALQGFNKGVSASGHIKRDVQIGILSKNANQANCSIRFNTFSRPACRRFVPLQTCSMRTCGKLMEIHLIQAQGTC